MTEPRILLLAINSYSSRIIYHYLNQYYKNIDVVFEKKESRWTFILRRIKRSGLTVAIGQVLFQIFIVPILNFKSQKRKQQILSEYKLDHSQIPCHNIRSINSVNSEKCREIIEIRNYDVVVVSGTRIISDKILKTLPGKFINIHAGITPQYRGVHGMYWALVNNDLENAGVTIHLVDAGIDSGKILYSKKIIPGANDNFTTYPLLQLAEGLPLLEKSIREISGNTFSPETVGSEKGKLWHHPEIWTYLKNLRKKKVK